MKNKGGFLLAEETLKIILAVIAIVFLIYFLGALYFSKINSDKLKKAEALLKESDESIERKIQNLNIINPVDFQLINPNGWHLLGFTTSTRPNSCLGKSCLCICDGISSVSFYALTQSDVERQANKCNEDGTCIIVENLKSFTPIKIDKQWIIIEEKNNLLEIRKK